MDYIPPGIRKENLDTTVELLYLHFVKPWKTALVNDWDKELLVKLVKLPNKGNYTKFSNWRAVVVLSVPSKVVKSS
jgi:hypothetical protein